MTRKSTLFVASALTLAVSSVLSVHAETKTLINFDEANIGNGNFNITQANIDAGLVGSINAFATANEARTLADSTDPTPAPPPPSVRLERHRAL